MCVDNTALLEYTTDGWREGGRRREKGARQSNDCTNVHPNHSKPSSCSHEDGTWLGTLGTSGRIARMKTYLGMATCAEIEDALLRATERAAVATQRENIFNRDQRWMRAG